MIRMTCALAVALYAAFVIWGRPPNGVPEPAARVASMSAMQADAPLILQNASAPQAAPQATRADAGGIVMPDPAAIAAAAPEALSLVRAPRLIGEPQTVSLIEPAAPAPAVPRAGISPSVGPLVEVTGSRVNLRAGPGVGNAVVGSLPRGALAEAIGAPEGGWQQVRDVNGGLTGYMFASYLAPI